MFLQIEEIGFFRCLSSLSVAGSGYADAKAGSEPVTGAGDDVPTVNGEMLFHHAGW